MKLNTLELQAFGPFAGKEIIRFDKLGENPLFLIDGPTGAGKSSILHGICYALYGETTDSERKDIGLRCDYASGDDLTSITLEFSIKEKVYRITRVPTQMRPAKRGSGETEEKASAHLREVRNDGTEATLVSKKKKEADDRIREIVGLSAEQFRQVMVLPQGKFRELLLAKSDDRQAILSTLFETELYKRIESLLKEKAADIEQQNKGFEQSIIESLSDVGVDDLEELLTKISDKTDQLVIDEKKKLECAEVFQQRSRDEEIAKKTAATFEMYAQFESELRNKQLESKSIEVCRNEIASGEAAIEISPRWDELNKLTVHISEIQEGIESVDKELLVLQQSAQDSSMQLAEVKSRYDQRDDLIVKEQKLKSYQAVLISYEEAKKRLQSAELIYQKNENEKNKKDRACQALEAIIDSNKKSIGQLEMTVSEKANVAQKISTATGLVKERGLLVEQQDLLTTHSKSVSELGDEEVKVKSAWAKAERVADHVEMTWYSSQAAILAEKLEEDCPCPVCGSHDHPLPAGFDSDISQVTKSEVDDARRDQDEHRKSYYLIEKNFENTKRLQEECREKVSLLISSLGKEALRSVDDLKSAQEQFESQLANIEEDENKLITLRKERATSEVELKKLHGELTQCNAVLGSCHAEVASEQRSLDEATATLPQEFRTLEALNQGLFDVQRQVHSLDAEYIAAVGKDKELQTNLSTKGVQKNELGTQLSKLLALKEKAEKDWVEVRSNVFETQQFFEKSLIERTQLIDLRKIVLEYDDHITKLSAQIGVLKEQLKDKAKPELVAFTNAVAEAQVAYHLADSAWVETKTDLSRYNEIQAKINNIEKQRDSIRLQYETVGSLAKAASGQGNVRVSLERFVLGALLDTVLSVASQRLLIMSKGQYRLVRQDEQSQKRNVTAGLDLSIDDSFTGKKRPVATLSGGESFIASLSLALALSDVVQQRSGGIQLDTLFIDEGFGSLDQESLQLAINTLIDLQSTGRSIGIISHVSELKEQMALRIDVVESRKGSSIRAVF